MKQATVTELGTDPFRNGDSPFICEIINGTMDAAILSSCEQLVGSPRFDAFHIGTEFGAPQLLRSSQRLLCPIRMS